MIIRSISLEKELNEKIQEYCKNTGRTVSGLIVFLLNKYLLEKQNEEDRSRTIPRQKS